MIGSCIKPSETRLHSDFLQITDAVKEVTGVDRNQMRSKSPKGKYVMARHIAIYYFYHEGHGVGWTGIMFRRDHTLVSYAHNKIEDLKHIDREVADLTRRVEEKLPRLIKHQ